jgi:hypothetical protein
LNFVLPQAAIPATLTCTVTYSTFSLSGTTLTGTATLTGCH